MGRNPSKLKSTIGDIREIVKEVEMKSVLADLAKEIDKEIKDLDVGVLINNACLGVLSSKFFHEVDLEIIESALKVTIEAATLITHSVLLG